MKVTVFVHVVFLKVGEIDTVKETYTADVFVQARWREPLFDGQTNLVLYAPSCTILNFTLYIFQLMSFFYCIKLFSFFQ